jgi:hypothetical protein
MTRTRGQTEPTALRPCCRPDQSFPCSVVRSNPEVPCIGPYARSLRRAMNAALVFAVRRGRINFEVGGLASLTVVGRSTTFAFGADDEQTPISGSMGEPSPCRCLRQRGGRLR